MDDKIMKKTLLVRKSLDSPRRRFVYNDSAEESFSKVYKFVEQDRKLLRYAEERVGTISDCYLLYAVAMLGVCDRRTLQLFLYNLKMHSPDLYIEDMTNDNHVKRRLSALCSCGLLFKVEYMTEMSDKKGPTLTKPVTLYTVDKEANSLMNMKLAKRVPYNNWLQAKLLPGLLSWSAACYAGVVASVNPNFTSYLDGVFRNSYLGVYYFPFEAKYTVNNIPAYVAYIDAFLYHDTRIQTKEDFDDLRILKINAIKNYLFARTKKGPAYVVVVVQDNADLCDMANLIIQTEVLLESLNNIFFIGEGSIRELDGAEDAFLQMYLDEKETATKFDFVAAKPPFLV